MDSMNYKIKPDQFALACVASSSQLSVKEKLNIYNEAYAEALSFNQATKKHTDQDNIEDYLML